MTDVTTGELASSRAGLRRDLDDRVVGGVCAGLGRRLGIDPVILRVAFVALAAAGGSGIVLYALAWLLIPAATAAQPSAPARTLPRRGSWQVAVPR